MITSNHYPSASNRPKCDESWQTFQTPRKRRGQPRRFLLVSIVPPRAPIICAALGDPEMGQIGSRKRPAAHAEIGDRPEAMLHIGVSTQHLRSQSKGRAAIRLGIRHRFAACSDQRSTGRQEQSDQQQACLDASPGVAPMPVFGRPTTSSLSSVSVAGSTMSRRSASFVNPNR